MSDDKKKPNFSYGLGFPMVSTPLAEAAHSFEIVSAKSPEIEARALEKAKRRERLAEAQRVNALIAPVDPRGMRELPMILHRLSMEEPPEQHSQAADEEATLQLGSLFLALEEKIKQAKVEAPYWIVPPALTALMAGLGKSLEQFEGTSLIPQMGLSGPMWSLPLNMANIPAFFEWEWKKDHTCVIAPLPGHKKPHFLVIIKRYTDIPNTGYYPVGSAEVLQCSVLRQEDIHMVHWQEVLGAQFSVMEMTEDDEIEPESVKIRRPVVKYQMLN